MQLVTRATSIAAVAVVFINTMLMQIAVAVEVTSGSSQFADAADDQADVIPPSPNCHILGSRSFSIPFSVDAAGALPVEVHLFVSRGPDDSWKLLDRKKPNVPQRQFQFEADGDGEFWFATRTVDTLGRSHPAGKIESQLKVYVDTTKPHVTLQADADADGRVDLTLSIHDATKLKDMQLRYLTDTLNQMVQVDLAKLSADGRLEFRPDDAWKQLSIQLVVTDTPGNQSVVNQLLRRPRLADSQNSRFAAAAPSRTATEAQALPYRIGSSDQLPAHPVSNPVIKLDRHQPRPVSDVTTAHGYAPDLQSAYAPAQSNTPFHGFRSAQTPLPQSPSMTYVPPPNLAPAPAPQFPNQQHSGAPDPAAPYQIAQYPGAPQPWAAQPQTVQPVPGSAPAYGYGKVHPQPAPAPPSLFNRLFGSSPAPSSSPDAGPETTYPAPTYPAPTYPATSYPAQAPSVSTAQPSQLGFGPPSVRGSGVQPRLAGTLDSGLPPPATPDQISNGFDLNSPGQSEPETIPVPSDPVPSDPVPSDSTPSDSARSSRPRAKTPAEAMRPIGEPSEVSRLTQEEVPAPQGQPEPYRSLRATPAPSINGSTVNPMQGSPASGNSTSSTDLSSFLGRVPVRYSDSVRFSLAYELEAVGAQGVEAIELYGSTDGGRTWELWGQDPDRTSPFDIETQEVGVFGFRIVVVSRNGLASPRPQSGETPDIVVVVDNQRPLVRITGAQYGEGDRIGSLIIRYECSDAYLTQRPISLAFSDSVDGPWTTIAGGLRNEGEYIWNADPNLPRQLFLRIDASDEAGNQGSYVLDQPIDTQGLAPRARIRGFQTISGAEMPPSQGQTATRPKALFK